ncbi:uncharacterized protein EAF01_003813 [Botrytis porri]|uniref:uncharacterized protein n=1 Tax=Botrytis porri TaxID=87229 RepID=UPI0019019A0B|nr:uncharacterized protein EAF01_003813 [Botrytis porri]KAF7908058.1 hypothetical protein EAF01_003813 [Botrytis porri]
MFKREFETPPVESGFPTSSIDASRLIFSSLPLTCTERIAIPVGIIPNLDSKFEKVARGFSIIICYFIFISMHELNSKALNRVRPNYQIPIYAERSAQTFKRRQDR